MAIFSASTRKVQHIGDKMTFIIENYADISNSIINMEVYYKEKCPRGEEGEKFINYISKKIRSIVNQFFPKNITIVERLAKNDYVDINLNIKAPVTFPTQKEKRLWTYNPDGPVIELLTVLNSKLPGWYDEYVPKGWKCGDNANNDKEE